MVRIMRGYPTAWSQPEGAEGPETNAIIPQQEYQPDTTEGKVIADYGLDIEYEGSEPKNEPDVQEEKEENSDAEYVNMEVPCDETFCQRMMPHNVM